MSNNSTVLGDHLGYFYDSLVFVDGPECRFSSFVQPIASLQQIPMAFLERPKGIVQICPRDAYQLTKKLEGIIKSIHMIVRDRGRFIMKEERHDSNCAFLRFPLSLSASDKCERTKRFNGKEDFRSLK
ncbi:hypothetical protein AtNW77_Chr3g0184751 [Arabidopsis thaliana]